jgi:hypothetical protein
MEIFTKVILYRKNGTLFYKWGLNFLAAEYAIFLGIMRNISEINLYGQERNPELFPDQKHFTCPTGCTFQLQKIDSARCSA